MWTVGGSNVDVAALHLEQVVPLVHEASYTVDAVERGRMDVGQILLSIALGTSVFFLPNLGIVHEVLTEHVLQRLTIIALLYQQVFE